jgi:hypothetical protein
MLSNRTRLSPLRPARSFASRTLTRPRSIRIQENTMGGHRIAVLDDFQNVSQQFGDWAGLQSINARTRAHVSSACEVNERPMAERCVPCARNSLRSTPISGLNSTGVLLASNTLEGGGRRALIYERPWTCRRPDRRLQTAVWLRDCPQRHN